METPEIKETPKLEENGNNTVTKHNPEGIKLKVEEIANTEREENPDPDDILTQIDESEESSEPEEPGETTETGEKGESGETGKTSETYQDNGPIKPIYSEGKYATVGDAAKFIKYNYEKVLYFFKKKENPVPEQNPKGANSEITDYGNGELLMGSNDKLSLNISGLKKISDTQAEILSNFGGEILDLSGLRKISDTQAEILSNFGGEILNLSELRKLSDTQAESLSNFGGTYLNLGIEEISDIQAESLSNFGGEILNLSELRKLSDTQAEILSNFEGVLELLGLEEINENALKSLSKIEENNIFLPEEFKKKLFEYKNK